MSTRPDDAPLAQRIAALERRIAERDAALLGQIDGIADDWRRLGTRAAGVATVVGTVSALLWLARGSRRSGARGGQTGSAGPDDRTRDAARQAGADAGARASGLLGIALTLASALAPGPWRGVLRGLRPRTGHGAHASAWDDVLPAVLGALARRRAEARAGAAAPHGDRPGAAPPASAAGATSSSAHAPATRPLRTVAQLNPLRYAGTWFEIACLPAGHAPPCASDATVRFRLADDGTLRVRRRCLARDGRPRVAHGVARAIDGAPAGCLRIAFAPRWLRWWPGAWADCRIIALAPDYRHALLGTPDRRRLWLLARAPHVERDVLRHYVEIAQQEGFPIDRLQRTPQREAAAHDDAPGDPDGAAAGAAPAPESAGSPAQDGAGDAPVRTIARRRAAGG